MESMILKAIWFIIHFIVDLIESLFYYGLEFRENFIYFIKNISIDSLSRSKKNELAYIEARINDLKKLPKHIAVILNINNKKDVDLSKLVNLVSWSMNSNVNFISFYDYKGILKNQLASSFHQLIKDKLTLNNDENLVWGPDYNLKASLNEGVEFPHRNGFIKHLVINIYSSYDSYSLFNKLLTDDELSSKDIKIENVNKKISKLYGNIPEPELALYIGKTTCTAGFLPWHIRLTEFIQISYKLKNLTLDKYIRVLYKYAKCEQRYGK
ncbi:hypothetical protein PVAND_013542 [Polypedilum vanderplanki]|uniref:ditrans,polycis-polyprenyl diphosphate synthase [(2E,6E)-farnesyldiphosphate specific] n=1 Tax=Polypedilum vanderplanki TaxID=319348 RepID=A0A9J6CRW9_POLVA|nr:hypothetical protein PVAND_013542 [Polypedilum vanderplanki]